PWPWAGRQGGNPTHSACRSTRTPPAPSRVRRFVRGSNSRLASPLARGPGVVAEPAGDIRDPEELDGVALRGPDGIDQGGQSAGNVQAPADDGIDVHPGEARVPDPVPDARRELLDDLAPRGRVPDGVTLKQREDQTIHQCAGNRVGTD